ncbi:hypothetical protein [uncultured Bacteroides sp.]|jgi:hypothetical protein|uniref:hypothetical protein n=1 Tax=uncultured Bacteroides sp. TaxID=162156 RepID=UPI002606BC5E|nr:hypothetical protein [uncultured Bacteroides sp.]
MELKDFIKQTIIDIKDAIQELNEEFEKENTVVNPTHVCDSSHSYLEGSYRNVTDIHFDLSLNATEEVGKEGKIGVMSSLINLGGSTRSGNTNENINRLQFTIPVCFPSRTVK